MPTTRGSIPRAPTPLSAEQRLARTARRTDAARSTADYAVAQLDTISVQVDSVSQTAQVAQMTGNVAYARADEAVGGATVSGSATDPAVTVGASDWVQGPRVNLSGVSAGHLTLTGSGPYQDADVDITGGDTTNEFRIVEIVGEAETVVFTGYFRVRALSGGASVTNLSVAAVAAFNSSRSSTGAVGYRIDARGLTGGAVSSLAMYIFARRST